MVIFCCTDSLFSWKIRNVSSRKLPIIKMLTHVFPLVSSRRLFALAFLELVQRNMRRRTSTSFTHVYQSSSCIWRKTVFWSVCTVQEMCLKPLSTGYVQFKPQISDKSTHFHDFVLNGFSSFGHVVFTSLTGALTRAYVKERQFLLSQSPRHAHFKVEVGLEPVSWFPGTLKHWPRATSSYKFPSVSRYTTWSRANELNSPPS